MPLISFGKREQRWRIFRWTGLIPSRAPELGLLTFFPDWRFRKILLGKRSLERALKERVAGSVDCHERLGGLLKYYYRDAA
ncbi:MAG: hypothetical protein CMJ46_05590 [Planctomyces sp.]|nr:hypothetical protein [Planctomyces sp.]